MMVLKSGPGPGRPPKYGRRSRAVTLTLPEDVIDRLSAVDVDLGRAIVTVTESAVGQVRAIRPAELNSYGNHAVIVVVPVKALKRLPGVQLVPVGNGRALISLAPPHSISGFEVDIRDALAREDANGPERQTLESIAGILREARQSGRVTLCERTIIVLESTSRRRGVKSTRERTVRRARQ